MGEEKGRRESLKLLSLVLNTSASLRDKRLEELIGSLPTPTQDKKAETGEKDGTWGQEGDEIRDTQRGERQV